MYLCRCGLLQTLFRLKHAINVALPAHAQNGFAREILAPSSFLPKSVHDQCKTKRRPGKVGVGDGVDVSTLHKVPPLRGIQLFDSTACWRCHAASNISSFGDCCSCVGVCCSGSRFVRDVPSMWHCLFMHRAVVAQYILPRSSLLPKPTHD